VAGIVQRQTDGLKGAYGVAARSAAPTFDPAGLPLRIGQCEGTAAAQEPAQLSGRAATEDVCRAIVVDVTAAAAQPGPELPPIPTLPPDATPQAICAALIGDERTEFERDYQAALTEAGRTLDLTVVLDVLRNWRHIAWITHRQGPDAHLRMLDAAARLMAGEDVPTVPGHVVKAEINARLGR
jgi:hypothetical protein